MIKPRHVICAIGNWVSFEPIVELLTAYRFGFELDKNYSSYSENPRMRRSFEVNQDKLPNTLTQEDWDAIDSHSSVAYILSPPLSSSNAEEVSGEALRIITALFENGATAVQSESAGLAHGKSRWLNLCKKYITAHENNDAFEMGSALYYSWVQKGILDTDNNINYSLGMHLLGNRDIEYTSASDNPYEAIKWMDLLGLYILADKPTRPIKEGEGFRLDESKRMVISHEKCTRKLEDDFQYNPYGYFRLNNETRFDKLKNIFASKGK